MVSETEFRAWLDGYERVWESGDPAGIMDLFTADAVYADDPFEEAAVGAEAIGVYWARITNQRDVDFRYEVLAVTIDLGISRWWCSFRRAANGALVELDGIFAVRLNDEGKCTEFREWWHRKETPPG